MNRMGDEMQEKNEARGIYGKYHVVKVETGEVVEDCFVLRPVKDINAVHALYGYAACLECDSPGNPLSKDIREFLGRIGSAPQPPADGER